MFVSSEASDGAASALNKHPRVNAEACASSAQCSSNSSSEDQKRFVV